MFDFFFSLRELNLTGICRLNNRPSLQEVQKAFRSTSILSYSVSLTLSAVLVLIWPAAMVGVGAMSLEQFTGWVWEPCTTRPKVPWPHKQIHNKHVCHVSSRIYKYKTHRKMYKEIIVVFQVLIKSDFEVCLQNLRIVIRRQDIQAKRVSRSNGSQAFSDYDALGNQISVVAHLFC